MAYLWKDKKSKYWQAAWRDENGKRFSKSTKIVAKSTTRRQAEKVAELYEETARNKKTAKYVRKAVAELQKEITGEDAPIATFTEFANRFLERKKGEAGKATMAFYTKAFGDFASWLEDRAGEDIANITRSDLDRYRNQLLERITATTTANKMKALRSLFRDAHLQGFILSEPTEGLKFARKNKAGTGRAEKRPFTLEEIRILLAEAQGEWRSMMLFGLYTGQRLGDLATLRWQQLDLVRGEYRTRTRKTGRTITIPLAEPLADHIARLPSPDDPAAYVHPELAAIYEVSGGTVSNQFAALLADCGLRPRQAHVSKGKGRDSERDKNALSFHCLRATAVTMLHEAGIPAATVQEWIGHDSEEVHKVYVKIGREQLQRASSAL
ncbi:MAG: tyrosine-type recombinase/integrase, partial [Verrucomicrobiales bacterium]